MKKRNNTRSNEVSKPDDNRDSTLNKHLEGFTEDEIRLIQLVAEIFVNAVVNHKKN